MMRPLHWITLLSLACWKGVHCWSVSSLLSGSDSSNDENGHGVDTNPDDKDKTDRTLSYFQQQFTHSIANDQPVSSRGRRDVEASVKAHSWPSTIFSPLCEAWAYLEAGISIGKEKSSSSQKPESNVVDSLPWKYLDTLVERGGIPSLDDWVAQSSNFNGDTQTWTFQNSTTLALGAVSDAMKFAVKSEDSLPSSSQSMLDETLLPFALSLRAHIPHCEMHRSLARDAAVAFGLYNVTSMNVDGKLLSAATPIPAAFCILSRVKSNTILGTHVIVDASLLQPAVDALESTETSMHNMDDDSSTLLMPLPHENFHPNSIRRDADAKSSQEPEHDNVAILYGQVGTSAFASLYQALKKTGIKFVVRHMGYIPYEEEIIAITTNGATKNDAMTPRAIPTVLQGYGVRLDIRNVEYKAFDDGPNDKSKDGDTNVDWTDASHHPDHPARNEYLAGVNLQTILGRFSDTDETPLPSDLQALQTALLQSHSTQLRSDSIVPPAWKRRSLSLQAAAMISSSSDPLETLKGISQNLPSVAHSLSNVNVPESFEDLARDATELAARVGAVSHGWGDAAFGLYINSRAVDVERPSFNVFYLLDILREEDKILRGLEEKIRPMLTRTAMLLGRKESESSDVGWAALQAVKKVMDMGAEKLVQMGKKSAFDEEGLVRKELQDDQTEDDDDYDGDDDDEISAKYRIDVGRGGKNAIMYLNDIEKDPEYRSWPTSLQQMFYSAQFGGAPTIRRNLFTLLIVIDPASSSPQPAMDMVAQLLNSQFPLRLGVLIVNNEDVTNKSVSATAEWNEGNRPFHARDAFLLLQYITQTYGGMAAISCLLRVTSELQDVDDTLSVGDYVGMHVSLLAAMRLINGGNENQVQNEIEFILKTNRESSDESPKKNAITYENAVLFAVDKLIRPGMSFINGIPLPDSSSDLRSFGMSVNEILQYEQRHIMELAMKGIITDTAPRSVYASLLSGDHLFKQYHPLLLQSAGEYLAVTPDSDELSLLLPDNESPGYNNLDALFVIEGVFDLSDPVGIQAALTFLEVVSSPPDTWHDTKAVSIAFRITSFGLPTTQSSHALSNLFCVASRFDAADLKKVTAALHASTADGSAVDISSEIGAIADLSADVREQMIQAAKHEPLCSPAIARNAKSSAVEEKIFYTANGRVYANGNTPMSIGDMKMLINLEMDRTNAMTKLLLPHLLPLPSESGNGTIKSEGQLIHNAIGKLTAILNEIFASSPSSSKAKNPSAEIEHAFSSSHGEGATNPLYFSWNNDSSSGNLQVEVSVILDPLTEPTQRVAPLLLAIRDFLKLPLRVIFAPRITVENDLPLSSYYRFVADPLAVPDSNPPIALFQNLPTNHLLTLRMDVPEPWDTQQAYGVQDSDNLRCDARYGCGDDGYLLANKKSTDESYMPVPSSVELARIEFGLKGLLFFGQCYDVSKNSPPNGLQLTLDRSKLRTTLDSVSVSEISIESDGSITQTQSSDAKHFMPSKEHADTLVMKTVGYWQLRANPGVWNLRIADMSRGAEIYHMVDGSVSSSGKAVVAKNSDERISKTLVMKDFSNHGQLLLVKRRQGFEDAELFRDQVDLGEPAKEDEVVHVFSLATGHAYERLLKIMMLSVTKRTKSPVKFWLFENFLSPSFKSSAKYMAAQIGCEVEFVTYKWPEWLRGQSEKQRLIWGYKILFLDVLFPLDVKKIIYVDADQVVRGDMTELWNLDLEGAPYGYTPFCDSREETLGYQFWRTGFWSSHLRGKPYHISALYVVDLERFRRELVGDKLRATYQQLSADPNSLANLDQDLPNYAQHDVRIFSLPQKWLWCESWCSDETKAEAMTIDLCNNPLHKEAKISMAKRVISGNLFEESWEELDEMVERYEQDFLASQ